jgi:pyruvate-ferredoxin/flavodoxin oxidoreductase
MPDLTDTAIRLYRRFFGDHAALFDADEIPGLVLDGNNAIAIAEASIVENAVLAGSFNDSSIDTAWRTELQRVTSNDYGGAISARSAEGPRGVMASAIGLALSGRRTTAFINGQDLSSVIDLMANAAGRHLPLVIHVTNQALATHGGVKGSGHEAIHMAMDSGFFSLFATNVQEAVDFTYIARRVAEVTLVPGMVVMDRVETAESAQDVRLLSPAQVRRFLGPADEQIDTPSPAQKLLLGEQRRRVPQWHNLDRPVLQGALHGPESFALGTMANQPYFNGIVSDTLADSLALFEKFTERKNELHSSHNLKRSKIVLIAQGSAVETAQVAADYLSAKEKISVGVIGINSIRPFPSATIIDCLRGKKTVAVLERLDTPMADDPPLMRELRACLDKAIDKGHRKQSDTSRLSTSDQPELYSVIYGVGGLPLRVADLVALPSHLQRNHPDRTVLGVDFLSPRKHYPKRQVMLDALHRAYPDAQHQGLKNKETVTGYLPAESISMSINRLEGQGYEPLALEIGSMLHQIQEGHVRCRPGVSWESWSSSCEDRCVYSAEKFADPGDDYPVHLSILATDVLPSTRLISRMRLADGLADSGIILVTHSGDQTSLWQKLSADLQQQIRTGQYKLAVIPAWSGAASTQVESAQVSPVDVKLEYLLGAVVNVLLLNKLLDVKESKIFKAREAVLSNSSAAMQSASLEAFRQGFESITLFNSQEISAEDNPITSVSEDTPIAVQHLRRTDDEYDSLPRFWDQVGVLYRDNELEELTVDPYLATGCVAPLSSTFRDFSSSRKVFPEFNPASCTGCGQCWTACPDSAIGSVAISPVNLIDAGIKLSGAVALRQVSSQLGARVLSQNKTAEDIPATAGEMLNEAFGWLSDKMSLAEDRKQAVDKAMQDLTACIGALPVAVTAPFFKDAEATKKDSAELLSIVVNPDNCKGCGLCVRVCEPGALVEEEQTSEVVIQKQALWNIWANTPDTSSETIERISRDPEIGPLPAALLSRYCSLAMSGGDGAESGSGEKIAMRMILGATEYRQQPVLNHFAKQVLSTGNEIKQSIKESLSSVLPLGDIEELEEGLNSISTPRADLATVADKIESDIENHSVDTSSLRRMIKASKDLTDLYWRLTEGINGLGRARFGLAIAQGSVAGWAGAFPNNSFQAPVVVDMTGDTAQLAAGLLEGQMRETCETVGLIRKARLEIDQTGGADFVRAGLNRLSWDQLEDEEKQLCPPLFLVGGDDLFTGRGLAQVTWLLNSDLPIKIVVLSDLGFGLTSGQLTKTPMLQSKNPAANLSMLALAQRGAFVAQTSIADSRHLFASITEAIKYQGPALINIHAPSPERHGFGRDGALQQAELAVRSRAFPLLNYDPRLDGVFGSRINLEANLDTGSAWVRDGAEIELTPAHWAVTESRFSAYFSPLTEDDASAVEVLEWLDMTPSAQRGKYAVITVGDDSESGSHTRYRLEDAMVSIVRTQQHNWQTLQELAGHVTPFTERVESEVRESLAVEHAAAIAALTDEYEQKIREMEENMVSDMSLRVRDQLISLMGPQSAENVTAVPADKE